MNETASRVQAHAHALGCPPLVFLSGDAAPEHLEYLDLFPARKTASAIVPDAVAEFQGRAILYLVDGNGPNGTSERITQLQTLLANRGEHACLGVTKPGSLDIYPINLDRQELQSARLQTVSLAGEQAPIFFQSLATGTFELDGRPEKADYVYETIHDLLASASEELAGTKKKSGLIPGLEVLSTTGRALFFRFLIDRRIVLESELPDICPGAIDLKDVFSSPSKAAATSAWLDETFNGDLLPLVNGLPSGAGSAARLRAYRDYYKSAEDKTNGRLFLHLQAILRGWKHVGDSVFQPSLDWDDLDFAHVPIGVLSQVYESFSHQWDEDHAEETSVHYTPRNLARILVNEAFAGVDNPAEAVVLDPACGAGVFLVLAFRRLVQEYWKKHGARPDIKAIQRILYKQIRGFEVSESALRLSALALYITAIEVNGTQRPPQSLKFPRALRNEVLYDFGHDRMESRKGFSLGSLGEHVPKHFDGAIDILVTNPPWTRLRADSTQRDSAKLVKEMNAEFTSISRRVLRSRGLGDLAAGYANPDNDPDLPFLWRATEWVRPGGLIAMALPARLILKQDGNGKVARDAVLQALTVTGILNGSDLEKTPVWPNMDLPFVLLFARNSLPGSDHRFHFVTPVRENRLSARGQFRIDYKSAETVGVRDVVGIPWLLKALAVGTSLDVDIVSRLPQRSVKKYWKDHDLSSGKGYNLAPGLKQQSAQHLLELLDLELPEQGFALPRNLRTWAENHHRTTALWPRDPMIYRAPLVIIPAAQRESRNGAKAFLSIGHPLAFSHSFYGFSALGSTSPDLVASMLYLLMHSQLFQHFCLMRSSQQGASFRAILKQDVEAFPFADPLTLPSEVQARILALAKSLSSGGKPNWPELDRLVNSIYGLDDHDTTVIEDTVTFCGPYRSVRERAEHPLDAQDLETFCSYLEDMLQPLFELTRQRIHVSPIEQNGLPPWHFVTVSMNAAEKPNRWKGLITRIAEEANQTGASRVVVRIPRGGGLIIGILNQRRFWTRSRARLCSLHIEEHHLDAFPVEAK